MRNSLTFTTVVDNQSTVEIHILQGEREIAQGNRSLGKFELVGIPQSPRGVPQIEVSFEVDANGIVSVSAKDKTTGREQQMRITPSSGLSADEINRLMLEAQASAESDRRLIELIGVRNKLDGLVRNTQLTFTEFGGAMSADERHDAQEIIAQGEKAAHSDDPEEINRALASVERLAAHLTNVMLNPASTPIKEVEGSH